ncbi:TetR/AcrR family transcriptional regulator [Pseudomonas sp. BGr12]|uniref:TetR/AcrR family transcriptional regulator n=1 Tax=Pseudomonas sp. BGr12 TaxID=2936269 RepID=UPI002559A480|nr:TetR/AcrR family transcriptional regulator [Pseudomonas sp. BJa5]MDL2428402.1 TetR/AcrR family transcriptional regulator [Pseudomonas sp. BJa5]
MVEYFSLPSRERIVEIATGLICESGYGAMTMRALAGQAGLLPGSLYSHFSNKQEILFEVLLSLQSKRFIKSRKISGAFPPDRALESFIDGLLNEIRRNPRVVDLKAEAIYLEEDDRQEYLRQEAAQISELSKILVEGMNWGLYRVDDPSVTARAMIAMVESLASHPGDESELIKGLARKLVLK